MGNKSSAPLPPVAAIQKRFSPEELQRLGNNGYVCVYVRARVCACIGRTPLCGQSSSSCRRNVYNNRDDASSTGGRPLTKEDFMNTVGARDHINNS